MSSTTSRSPSNPSPLASGGESKASALQLTSENLAVEHVAYAHSDLLFAYPSSDYQYSYLDRGSELWAKAGLSDATNYVLASQFLQMSSRASAASVVIGAVSSAVSAKATSATSTLAAYAAILNMVPNLYRIARANRPTVIDVKYGLHGASLTQAWIKALVHQVHSSSKGTKMDLASIVVAEPEIAQEDVNQVTF